MKRLALAFIIAAVACTAAAVAQTAPAPSAPIAIDMLRPYLRDLFYTIGSILMGLATLYLKQRWGIDLDAARRASFQTASTNAAGLYATTGDMSRAVEYLKDAAPDAIKHFDITAAQLPEKIQAKAGIIEAGGGVIPVMPGAVDSIAMRGQGL